MTSRRTREAIRRHYWSQRNRLALQSPSDLVLDPETGRVQIGGQHNDAVISTQAFSGLSSEEVIDIIFPLTEDHQRNKEGRRGSSRS